MGFRVLPFVLCASIGMGLVQADRAKAQDVWRSPSGNLSSFPHLGSEDCETYGSAYGYSECSIHRQQVKQTNITRATNAKAASPETVPPSTPPAPAATANLTPYVPSIPVRRTLKLVGDRCLSVLAKCYAQCKSHAFEPDTCNLLCSTDTFCAWTAAVTYGDFLEQELEALRSPRRIVPAEDKKEVRVAKSE